MKQVKMNIDNKTYKAIKKACEKKIGIIERIKNILKRRDDYVNTTRKSRRDFNKCDK